MDAEAARGMRCSGMTGERSQERSQSREQGKEGDEERARAHLPSSVHQCMTTPSPKAGLWEGGGTAEQCSAPRDG